MCKIVVLSSWCKCVLERIFECQRRVDRMNAGKEKKQANCINQRRQKSNIASIIVETQKKQKL